MSRLTAAQQSALQHIVPSGRARFDQRERRVYSHDTSLLPGLVHRLAGATLADGVVQPTTEAKIVALVRYAQQETISLVPRGKATSGYAGAVPAQGGLVVDLSRLTGVIELDPLKA
jgi:FAD/FMN-containing dehydrogenase